MNRRWVLLDGSRWIVAGAVLGGIFVTILSLGWLGVIGARRAGSTTILFGVLLVGNFTLITVVFSINQLLLSWELNSFHDLYQQKKSIREFRAEVSEVTDVAVSPAEPTAVLRVLLRVVQTRADAIDEIAADADTDFEKRVQDYTETVTNSIERSSTILGRTDRSTFSVLSAMMSYNDAWQRQAARQLQYEYQTRTDHSGEVFDEIIEILQYFSIARQYFKSIYIEQGLARLSQRLFIIGIPALTVAFLVVLFYANEPTPVLTGFPLIVFISLAGTIALTPLAVLFAYVLRITTILIRTPSIEPFLTEE